MADETTCPVCREPLSNWDGLRCACLRTGVLTLDDSQSVTQPLTALRQADEHTRFIAARALRAFAAKITDDGDVASLIKDQMIVDADQLYLDED